jgi:hypothetical protein
VGLSFALRKGGLEGGENDHQSVDSVANSSNEGYYADTSPKWVPVCFISERFSLRHLESFPFVLCEKSVNASLIVKIGALLLKKGFTP